MLDNNTIIKVKNRSNGSVGYTIPDLNNLHRNFQNQEEKEISFEEIKKLSYIPGGMFILKNYLVMDNPQAIKEILGTVEPEYNYSEQQIKELLLNGTLDQFLDTLDFAPEGVIELIKNYAVELKLNDISKREAIFDKTGFNVTKAIEANKASAEDETQNETNSKVRRAQPYTSTESEEQPKVIRRAKPVSEDK